MNPIDEYIANFPKEIQAILQKIRNDIKDVIPSAEETISYKMPTFKFNGKNLVHFAAYNNHIGFYPTPSGIKAFSKELNGYKNAKGSVQFPFTRTFPYDLIKRITLYRVRELSVKK